MKKRVVSVVGLVMSLVSLFALLVLPLPTAAQGGVLGCSVQPTVPWRNDGSTLVSAAGSATCSPAGYHTLRVTLQIRDWVRGWADINSVSTSGNFGYRWRSVNGCYYYGYYRTKVTLDSSTYYSAGKWLNCSTKYP